MPADGNPKLRVSESTKDDRNKIKKNIVPLLHFSMLWL